MVRVADVDAHHIRAIAAGANNVSAPADYPYGERQYSALDPEGHRWIFSQSIADVDPASWGGELLETLRPGLDQERRAVLTTEREWAAAAKDRDLDRSVSYMADDAMMFPPASPAVVGKPAIREYMATAFATPGFSVAWVPEDVLVAPGGNFAYTHSRSVYTVPGADGKIQTLHAKGVAIWRKDASGWRCVVDIWNEAPPPAAVPQAGSSEDLE